MQGQFGSQNKNLAGNSRVIFFTKRREYRAGVPLPVTPARQWSGRGSMRQMTERSQNLPHKGSDGREHVTLYKGPKSLDRCPSELYRIGAREPGCRNRVAKLLENRRAVAHALCVPQSCHEPRCLLGGNQPELGRRSVTGCDYRHLANPLTSSSRLRSGGPANRLKPEWLSASSA